MSSSENPLDDRELGAAMKAFIRAIYLDPPGTIYQVLVTKQALLLTEAAEQYLQKAIGLEEVGFVEREFELLEFHVARLTQAPVPNLKFLFRVPSEILTDARTFGVDAAWQRFVAKYGNQ